SHPANSSASINFCAPFTLREQVIGVKLLHMRLQTWTTMLVLLMAETAQAQTPALRVFASNGMQAVINELRPKIEKELGRPLDIQFATSVAIRGMIESGQVFDATVMTSEVVSDLAKAGKIDSKAVVELGRSGIGFGVRAGASEPDVKTSEAVKKTLLSAKSLTWVSVGASNAPIGRMITELGIEPQVKGKTILTESLDESLALITGGKAEIILTLISEIVPAKGVKLVGSFPAQFQNYVTFSGGVNTKSSIPAAGALFLKQLTLASAESVYKAKGMELLWT